MAENEGDILDLSNIKNFSGIERQESKLEKVVGETRSLAEKRMNNATTLGEFFLWHRAASFSTSEGLGWIFDLERDVLSLTPEYMLSDNEDKRRIEDQRQEANIAEKLREMLTVLPSQEGKIRVAIRSQAHSLNDPNDPELQLSDQYRVLAAYPEAQRTYDSVIPSSKGSGEDYIYFQPTTPCIEKACRGFLGKNSEGVFYLPVKTIQTILQETAPNTDNVMEYDLHVDNPHVNENYLLASLGGYMSTEPLHVRVSDYWKKEQQVLSPSTPETSA